MECSLNTIPTGAQSPAKSAADAGVSCEGADLAGQPLDALIQYYEACESTANHLVGFAARPINKNSAGGRLMDSIIEFLDDETAKAVRAIRAYRPSGEGETRDRARFLIGYECHAGEGLSQIAALAATLAVPERH